MVGDEPADALRAAERGCPFCSERGVMDRERKSGAPAGRGQPREPAQEAGSEPSEEHSRHAVRQANPPFRPNFADVVKKRRDQHVLIPLSGGAEPLVHAEQMPLVERGKLPERRCLRGSQDLADDRVALRWWRGRNECLNALSEAVTPCHAPSGESE